MSRKLFWQIFPSYLILIVIGILLISLFSIRILKNTYYSQKRDFLEKTVISLINIIPEKVSGDQESFQDFCETASRNTGIRITIIRSDGLVLGDSDQNPELMDNHNEREEISEAFQYGTGYSERYSTTLAKNMMYTSSSFMISGEKAVLRCAAPIEMIEIGLFGIYRRIILVSVLFLCILSVITVFIARSLTRPILQLQTAANRYKTGDLSYIPYVDKPAEAQSLAVSLRSMAEELNQRLEVITEQRNELEAMLSSMVEAVIVLDETLKITRLNPAAVQLTGAADPENNSNYLLGKNLIEVFRNSELHDFAQKVFKTNQPLEAEITFYKFSLSISGSEQANGVPENEILYLQAHGIKLPGGSRDNETRGILLVLNDITQLKYLEKIRKDFVANVSHELKTPITSIKGFVETLQQGAIYQKNKADHFLSIINRHTDRLSFIIEDLLSLSRLEQQNRKKSIERSLSCMRGIIAGAVSICSEKIESKKIQVKNNCNKEVYAEVNSLLLEQAFVNLIDNAVKYSEMNGEIIISCEASPDNLLSIRIRDFGKGIPREDLSRIFERFYRVDKARSRELGGTGLGLSIVKHIVLAHEGSVNAESELGKGSTFTLTIPLKKT